MPVLKNADTDYHRHTEQATNNGTPPSGFGDWWVKDDGTPQFTNDAGTDFDLTSGGGLSTATELTIATGAVTKTQNYHFIDTEGDAATDDLDTISGGSVNDMLYIFAASDVRDVVIKNGTGNILTFGSADITLNEDHKLVMFIYDGTNWREVSNAAAGAGTGDMLAATYDPAAITEQLVGLTASQTLTNKTIDVNNNTFLNAGSLDMLKIGTPQYSTMRSIQGTTHSAGLVAGGALSNNGDGTITIAAGDGLIKPTDSDVADLYTCEWVADPSFVLTDNSINYVYMAFVNTSTNPAPAKATSKPADLNTNILLGTVYRSGVELHITLSSAYNITNHIKKITDRFQSTEHFQHAIGGALSETGTQNIAISAGEFWDGLNEITTIAQDTSGVSPDNNHTFEYFYRDGAGGWTTHEETIDAVAFTGTGLNDATSSGTFVGSHTLRIHVEIDATGTPDTFKWSYKDNDGVTVVETTGVAITGGAQTLVDGISITFAATTGHTVTDAWDFDAYLSAQIDNTQYDDNSGTLATLANSRYGVHWVYLDIHGHIAVLFGQGSYTLTDAQDAAPPASNPPEFEEHTRLVGRIIIAKSASIFTSIGNNYAKAFQSSVPTAHSDLTGLSNDDHTQYSLISSGAGAPSSTPSRVGEVYVDTTADVWYISTDTASSADWDLAVRPNNIQDNDYTFAVDAGANDTYVITLSPAPTAYAAGQTFHFDANTVNTGAATLNVNGLGAKTIVKHHDQTLANGDIEAGQHVSVIYDGTNFQMQSQLGNAPSGGGSGAMTVLVGPTTLGSTSATIDLTSISAAYQDLVLIVSARGDTAAAAVDINVRFNGDTGSNYSYNMDVIGTGGASTVTSNDAQTDVGLVTAMPGSTATANYHAAIMIEIIDYTNTGKTRQGYARASNITSNLQMRSTEAYFAWMNTANAINQITLTPSAGNFDTGTVYTLYGRS